MNIFRKTAIAVVFCLVTAALMGCSKEEQTLQPASTEKIAVPAAINVDLSKYVGKHPTKILIEPIIAANLKALLGNKFVQFVDNLNVGSSFEDRGEYYFGEGCAPHNCTIDESAFVVSKKDLRVYAVLLTDGDKLTMIGAASGKDLPLPLGEWYQARGGKDEIAKSEPTGNLKQIDSSSASSNTNSASSNSKYTRTKEDVALQCHYKDPRSANNWIYIIDSDRNEVNKIFEIKDSKIDVTHNINKKLADGREIVFKVESISSLITKQLMPQNFDPSDYEKFSIDRNSLEMDREIFQKKLSSYPSNYSFICEIMSDDIYIRLIDNIMEKRAASKAKEATNKI